MFNRNLILTPITDVDYYYMIENQIRREMPLFEVGYLLPLAEELLLKSNIKKEELEEYPIEGYYYKSEALQLYFTILRNLQMNMKLFDRVATQTSEYDDFKFITDSPLWGRRKPYPIPGYENAPLKRKYDLVTLTMEDKDIFNTETETQPWTIEKIMKGCSKYYSGRTLVDLGYLTQDARCVCAGAESNCGYRMFAQITGCMTLAPSFVWKVSPSVRRVGVNLINEYNKLISSSMIVPDIFNHTSLNKRPEVPRVSKLGRVLFTGTDYYWILDRNHNLSDQYTTEKLTTQMFQ